MASEKKPESVMPGVVFSDMEETMKSISQCKATLTELASRVPESSLEDLKDQFMMGDRENTGKLPSDRFVKCLINACMNATEREINVLLSELDPKETGKIDYNEFLNFC